MLLTLIAVLYSQYAQAGRQTRGSKAVRTHACSEFIMHSGQIEEGINKIQSRVATPQATDGLICEFNTSVRRGMANVKEKSITLRRKSENGFRVRVITDLNVGNQQFFQGASLFSNSLTNDEIVELMMSSIPEDTGMTFPSVPAGEYLFVSNWHEGIDQMNSISHVVCKRMTIDQDMDIHINKDDPEYVIKFIDTLPDGKEVKLPNLVVLPDGNRERDWTNATIGTATSKTYIVDPEWRDFFTIQGASNYECDGIYFPEFNLFDALSVHINSDVPESFYVVRTYTLDDEKGNRYITHSTAKPAMGSQTIYGNSGNYIEFSQPDIIRTPFGDSDKSYNAVLKYQELMNGIASDLTTEITLMPGNRTYLNVAPYYEGNDLYADLRINYESVEFEETVSGPFGQTTTYKDGIITPWGYLRNGKFVYDGFDRSQWPNLKGFLYEPVTEPYPIYWLRSYCGEETLMTDQEDALSAFGESTPYCVTPFDSQTQEGSTYQCLYPTYFGQLGEVRTIDLKGLTIKVRTGENISEFNHREYMDWMNNRIGKDNSSDISITFINQNSETDGLQGRNETTVSYDETQTDLSIPMINLIRFKNADGKTTNSFDSSEYGLLEFHAGCFSQIFSTAQYEKWYESDTPSVKVEYSPYQHDAFKELSAVEIPELYLMPGFGHYYKVALREMTDVSSTKWYDLRLTVKGENGSEQQQTISPAFRVNSLSGVETVYGDADSVQVSGRNILTPAGSRIYTMQGTMTDGRNVMPGIYLVKTSGGVAKVLVK